MAKARVPCVRPDSANQAESQPKMMELPRKGKMPGKTGLSPPSKLPGPRKGADEAEDDLQRDLERLEEYLAGIKASPGTLTSRVRGGVSGLLGEPLDEPRASDKKG